MTVDKSGYIKLKNFFSSLTKFAIRIPVIQKGQQ